MARRNGRKDGRRAVLYLRQSTYREESVSLEQQETACRDYATRHGYEIAAVISDPGLSGRKWSRRPGVQRAMAMLDDDHADVIVLWKWSRISRRRLDFEVAMDRAETVGGRIESATEPIDVTTASGKFARGMLAEVAAFESARIGEDWRATHQRRRTAGQPAQGGDRYGYTRKGDRYEIDEEQAEVLRWAYERYIDGRGAAWIAAELNRRGHTNRVGHPWQQRTTILLLDSGFAAGLLIHHPRDDENRKVGEPVYYPGEHPQIISTATWERYRAARRSRTNRPARTVEARYRLSGLVVCADCGTKMWPARAKHGGAGHTLVCGRWQATRTSRCVTVARHRAETAVKDWLVTIAEDVERAAAADDTIRRRLRRAQRDRKQATRRVAELEGQLSELALQLARKVIPQAGYEAARDQLLSELQRAQADVEAADIAAAARPPHAQATALGLLEQWDTLATADVRNLASTLIARVEVFPPERPHGRSTLRVVPIWDDV